MNGKNKCKLLKEIRQRIAAENDIALVTSECKFQGECSGTCPKCEAEVRYLEQELEKRHKLGKTVAVAGVAAAILVGTGGCRDWVKDQLDDVIMDGMLPNDAIYVVPTEQTESETVVIMGEFPEAQ